jgi:putative peptidoglycan lipid II flippase
MALTLALTGPCLAGFLVLPDLIMRAVFARGAFTATDAEMSGAVLAAYALGLPAIVLIRSAVASFHARGDTRTPMLISFAAIGVNVLLKILLAPRIGAPGLALATAAGAWINLAALLIVAHRRSLSQPTADFLRLLVVIAAATLAAGLVFVFARAPVAQIMATSPHLRDVATLAALGVAGLCAYAAIFVIGAKLARVRLSMR